MNRSRYAWHPGNNGPNRLRWFVCRDRRDDDPRRGRKGPTEYAETPTGRLRRFASMEAAQRFADELNAVDWQPFNMCGVQAVMPNGKTVTCEGWQNGSGTEGGFVLTYLFEPFKFSSRADAYAAADLLAASLQV